MAEKVLVIRKGQSKERAVRMDARLARALVAKGRIQYVLPQPEEPTPAPPTPKAPAPRVRREAAPASPRSTKGGATRTKDMKAEPDAPTPPAPAPAPEDGAEKTEDEDDDKIHYRRRDVRAEE